MADDGIRNHKTPQRNGPYEVGHSRIETHDGSGHSCALKMLAPHCEVKAQYSLHQAELV
jgi:hypothetical protein